MEHEEDDEKHQRKYAYSIGLISQQKKKVKEKKQVKNIGGSRRKKNILKILWLLQSPHLIISQFHLQVMHLSSRVVRKCR